MAAPKYLDNKGRIIAPSVERPTDMTPVTVRLPKIADLSTLSDSELLAVAQRYGIYAPWREVFAANSKSVYEISQIPPGSIQFWDVVRNASKLDNATTKLGLARGAMRSYNQLIATDGRKDQVLVRVGEGDELMCEGCMAVEGSEGTYGEHDAIGLPGKQDCHQNCRCMLIPVDAPDSQRSGDVFLTQEQFVDLIPELL